MRLIGINGFKRSGKGETHLAIERLLPEQIVLGVGFADKLKQLAALTLGYNEPAATLIEQMDWFKEFGGVDLFDAEAGMYMGDILTGREYLQNLGNEARGLFGDTFWIDQVLPNPATDMDDGLYGRYPGVDVLCITDLRYPNEAERVRDLGGEVWEIIKPGLESDGHASEIPLPRELVSVTIYNNGTLEDLENKVQSVLDR